MNLVTILKKTDSSQPLTFCETTHEQIDAVLAELKWTEFDVLEGHGLFQKEHNTQPIISRVGKTL